MKITLQQNKWYGDKPTEISLPDGWNVEYLAMPGDKEPVLTKEQVRERIERRSCDHLHGYKKQGIMTLKEAQKEVDSWIKQYGVRYFSELTNMAVLTEEVGELARVMARKYGDQSFKEGEKDNIEEEIADVLWVLLCIANQTGVDITEAFARSIEKKTKRDQTRHINNPKLSDHGE